jgi:RHS repeat-associated protein
LIVKVRVNDEKQIRRFSRSVGSTNITDIGDNLDRLTKEQITDSVYGDRASEFIYDKVGNRLLQTENVGGTVTTTAYVYDGNDRLLREMVNGQVAVNYSYDAKGNTISKQDASGSTLYDWNDEGRLVGAIVLDSNGDPQQQMEYRYNSSGIRVASSLDGHPTSYLIDESHVYAQILEEYFSDGTLNASYSYGNSLIQKIAGSSVAYYLKDGLGSIRQLANVQGSELNSYDYKAFGELLNQSGTLENYNLFAGERYDQSLGNYYFRDRYYNPEIGRFSRRDVFEGYLSQPQRTHKYNYGDANPVNNTDPSGFYSIAEAYTAASIANTLNGMQAWTGQNIFFGILNNEVPTPKDLGMAVLFDLALIAMLPVALLAAPIVYQRVVRQGINGFLIKSGVVA